jgi:lysophospholipase L1-like esterase
LPAHLQQLLSAGAGVPVEVTNFGQRAWVSTQGLVRLMLELQQAAEPPDIVVFYDGYNDVYAAYSSGRTGVPENFGNMRDQMQASGLRRVLASTETYRLMQRMLARGSPSPAPDERMTAMAQHVVQTYLRNHAMAQALGQPHRSDVWFFWQPQLMMGAKPLTPQEDAIARSHPWLAPDVKVLTRAAYAHLAAALPRQGMVDLSDALDGTRDLAYLDPCHLNGIGNRAVAQAMADRGLLAAVRRAAERRRNGG